MAQSEASFEAKMCVWVRGVSAINLLMPIDLIDSGSLDPVEYAGRLIAYHRTKNPSTPTTIRYSQWLHVARKMKMRTTTAWAFFSAVQTNESSRALVAHPEQPMAGVSHLDPAVNLTHLALCIALQTVRKRTSLASARTSDDRHPAAALNESSDGSAVLTRSARMERDASSYAVYLRTHKFVAENLERLLNVALLADASLVINEYHKPPKRRPSDRIGKRALTGLDYLFEGANLLVPFRHFAEQISAEPVSQLLTRSLYDNEEKAEFSTLLKSLREALIADPFMIQGGLFAAGNKLTRASTPQRTVLSVKAWKKFEALLEDKFADCHLRISDGKEARLLLAPRRSETAVVEDCVNAMSIVLGPVRETALLRRLRDCCVSVICGRLIVEDCVDCRFFVRSPVAPLLVGTANANIFFAPYNAMYEGLQGELEAQGLNLNDMRNNLWDRAVEITSSTTFSDASTNGYAPSHQLLDPAVFRLEPLPFDKIKNNEFREIFMSCLPNAYRKSHEEMKRRAERAEKNMDAATRAAVMEQFSSLLVSAGYDQDIMRIAKKARKQREQLAK
uniref:Tubulin binding cofactor C-like domain-containing protein n=1 Tax=Plectus sambesii TaxID=2011161 RepID=A0A914WF08_9BILA